MRYGVWEKALLERIDVLGVIGIYGPETFDIGILSTGVEPMWCHWEKKKPV